MVEILDHYAASVIYLTYKGYKDVMMLKGGMNAWQKEG
jgi:3-mercaptopyruvate sulfurtransferase SseA